MCVLKFADANNFFPHSLTMTLPFRENFPASADSYSEIDISNCAKLFKERF